MKLSEIVPYTIGLSAVPAQTAGFSVPGLIVDASEVPIDKRIEIADKSTYATIFTTTTSVASWLATLWGQSSGGPTEAYVIRWVSAASSPYFVAGSPGTTLASYTAVTAADLAITDGTSTEEFSTGTMAGVTSMADVAAIIQTEVRTSVTFAADLSAATVTYDRFGRFILTSADTGSTAETYSIIAPTGGAGTDITTANFLNIGTQSFVVAGLDAEDPDDALAAALEIDETPFLIAEIGASIAQQQALATACAVYKKFYEIDVRDADAKDSGASTDIAYLLSNASNNNAHGSYNEHTAKYPSAAIIGEIGVMAEGKGQLSLHALSEVNQSGLDSDGVTVKSLTATERSALDAKYCDYLVKPANLVHLVKGLTFGGIEVRHRIGYYWAEKRTAEEVYAFLMTNQVTTFSDKYIQALGAIAAKYLGILVDRECVESYALNLPSAADISAIEKATHVLTLTDVASIISQYAINSVVMTATATV